MTTASSYRQDIQFLRGIAVLTVVLYHTGLGVAAAGYLGVDIFFVISGFLITGMIAKQLDEGRFSFATFYFRRAKRLLPAAYVTFTVTALLGLVLLTSIELDQLMAQVVGAVTFTANFVLRSQGSYFGGDAELKPLLHTWSLSIEEQYYLIVPALLAWLPRRWWLRGVVAATVVSFALCIAVGLWRADVAFYMFPTRAWEMGLGSFGAMVAGTARADRLSRILFWPSLVAVLVLPFVPMPGLHPGPVALVVCLATLVVILRGHRGFDRRALRPMTWTGDISYSLYLVHWPLFAFANNLWIGDVPLPLTLGIVAASFALAWLQYRFVEQPVHKARFGFSWPRAGVALAASAAVVAVPVAAAATERAPADLIFARRGNTGLGPQCVSDRSFRFDPSCATGPDPTLLVWGDSYAMHLVPGIVQERGGETIVQATKYICGPMLGISPIFYRPGSTQNRGWAEGCNAYNNDVLDYVRRTPGIRTVVLASVFDNYMTHGAGLLTTDGREVPGGVEATLPGLQRTIAALRAMGRRVVVVGPPPALRWDAGLCGERRLRDLPSFGRYADCTIPDADYRAFRADVLRFVALARDRLDVEVVMFDDYLRRGDHYVTLPTDRLWYIPNGHFSYQGSRDVARGMGLVPLIQRSAR